MALALRCPELLGEGGEAVGEALEGLSSALALPHSAVVPLVIAEPSLFTAEPREVQRALSDLATALQAPPAEALAAVAARPALLLLPRAERIAAAMALRRGRAAAAPGDRGRDGRSNAPP